MKTILVLNGPNLNMLGTREPEIYGGETLEGINRELAGKGEKLGFALSFYQSNHEGALVEKIQKASQDKSLAGIIINPAAYTHTSVAIQDALKLIGAPIVEVHLSNIFKREPFRHHSYVSPVATGVVSGFGREGYFMALSFLAQSK